MKTSDLIQALRAEQDIKKHDGYATMRGEDLPQIYQIHMSAINDERHIGHARSIVKEMFELLKDSPEGPSLGFERELEIEGLIKVWEADK